LAQAILAQGQLTVYSDFKRALTRLPVQSERWGA